MKVSMIPVFFAPNKKITNRQGFLDRQIRLIRLVCNCTLHFSEFIYEFVTSKNQVIVGTIPHIDQRIEKNNIPFSIGKDQIKSIEKCFLSR